MKQDDCHGGGWGSRVLYINILTRGHSQNENGRKTHISDTADRCESPPSSFSVSSCCCCCWNDRLVAALIGGTLDMTRATAAEGASGDSAENERSQIN